MIKNKTSVSISFFLVLLLSSCVPYSQRDDNKVKMRSEVVSFFDEHPEYVQSNEKAMFLLEIFKESKKNPENKNIYQALNSAHSQFQVLYAFKKS